MLLRMLDDSQTLEVPQLEVADKDCDRRLRPLGVMAETAFDSAIKEYLKEIETVVSIVSRGDIRFS